MKPSNINTKWQCMQWRVTKWSR